MSNNEEYMFFKNNLKSEHFELKLEKFSKKYANKKILIYGNGLFFDVITDNYDLKKYFNIIGISDIRYEKTNELEYKTFKTFKPSLLKDIEIDVILVAMADILFIKKHLKNNLLPQKNIKIEAINKDFLNDIFRKNFSKLSKTFKTFKTFKNPVKALKYSVICNEEELLTKINYENIKEKIRLNKTKKIKVAFICLENQKWGYQSVYDEMKSDDNFEVLPIINLPVISPGRSEFTQKSSEAFFNKLNIPSIDGYDDVKQQFKDLKTFEPDIVFYQQTWYTPKSQLPIEVSKYALTCIITYGFFLICTESWRELFANHKKSNFWKILAESKYHKPFYENAGHFAFKDIVTVTGYPKLDCYNNPINEEYENLWKDKETPKKPRIIWAPHWTIGSNLALKMSGFKEHYDFFLNLARNHNEYNFLFKPHPMLKYQCIKEGFMSEEAFDNYLNEWNTLPNAVVYNDGNYFDIFKTSDIMVTDSSSFLAEYFYSKKPIIFLKKGSRNAFNRFGLNIEKGFYTPNSLEEIENLLKQLLIDKIDPLKGLRKRIIRQNFYTPKSGVGKGIVDMIKKELGRN